MQFDFPNNPSTLQLKTLKFFEDGERGGKKEKQMLTQRQSIL